MTPVKTLLDEICRLPTKLPIAAINEERIEEV